MLPINKLLNLVKIMSISTDDFLRFKGGVEQNDFAKILNLGADENTVRAKSLYHNVDDLKNFLTKNTKNYCPQSKHRLIKLKI